MSLPDLRRPPFGFGGPIASFQAGRRLSAADFPACSRAAAAAACLAAFLLSPRAELTYGDVERIAFGECADCEEGACDAEEELPGRLAPSEGVSEGSVQALATLSQRL